MRKALRYFSILLIIFLITACEKAHIPQETGIEEMSEIESAEVMPELKDDESSSEISVDEITNHSGYFITELYWLDNQEILMKLNCQSEVSEEEDLPTHAVYVFNIKTKEFRRIFEGFENNYNMDGNAMIRCSGNKMYLYNVEYCLEFIDLEYVKTYNTKEIFDEVFGENTYKGSSLNINKDGICSLVYKGDIVTFSLDNVKDYEVLIKQTSELVSPEKMQELVDAGLVDELKDAPATYYYLPLWSPDGKWISFNERESTELHESVVVMHNIADKTEKSFTFNYMDCYVWADTENYVIGYAWPSHVPEPEIKVYDLNTDECKSYIFNEAIEGVGFSRIKVLDVSGSKTLLSCYKSGRRPLLIFDFMTGEKEWLTSPEYNVREAVISPNGEKVLFSNNSTSIEVINIK